MALCNILLFGKEQMQTKEWKGFAQQENHHQSRLSRKISGETHFARPDLVSRIHPELLSNCILRKTAEHYGK